MIRSRTRSLRFLALALSGILASTGLAISLSPTKATAAPANEIVQLGDSYSAGNGAGRYTDQQCFRSPGNYGAQVAARLGVPYRNVACSGAVVSDITAPAVRGPRFLRVATYSFASTGGDITSVWMARAKERNLCGAPPTADLYYDYNQAGEVVPAGKLATGSIYCQLRAEPQINAVTPQTKQVFLTMGGNDIGFTDIAVNCIALRLPKKCQGLIDKASADAPAAFNRLKNALSAIKARSKGRATITLLNYPYLINRENYTIPEGALPGTGYNYGASLAKLQQYGDQLAAKAVADLGGAKAGYRFLDIKPAWQGRTHGIDPRIVANTSNSWIWPILNTVTYAEWVHPRPAGWNATANALYASVTR